MLGTCQQRKLAMIASLSLAFVGCLAPSEGDNFSTPLAARRPSPAVAPNLQPSSVALDPGSNSALPTAPRSAPIAASSAPASRPLASQLKPVPLGQWSAARPRIERLPPIEAADEPAQLATANYVARVTPPASQVQPVTLVQTEMVPVPSPMPDPGHMPPVGYETLPERQSDRAAAHLQNNVPRGVPMNLVSALQATDANNPQVQFARWRVQEAYAQVSRSEILWLPHLRMGISYNRHEQAIQDVAGNVFDTSRGGYYGGLGAVGVGQGSPQVPGVWMNFHTADAIFQPKILASQAEARAWASQTAMLDAMYQSASLYLDLLRAEGDAEIARETLRNTKQLADLTNSYAKSGQGLASDYDRSQADYSLRENELLRAIEQAQVASVRLATHLRIDPSQPLLVQEPVAAPIRLYDPEAPLGDLVAEGLSQRPELSESRWLVSEAVAKMRREKFAPLLPSVLLGASYGGMGGGLGTNFSPVEDRFDGDAAAYWEIRNFGLGERAARTEAATRIEQAQWRNVAIMDRVAGEVVEAHARVKSRQQQIAVAERGIQAALDSHRRNLKRIESAQGLPIEALQSVQALGAARRDYLRAVIDYNLAQFQLLRAVGGAPTQLAQETN